MGLLKRAEKDGIKFLNPVPTNMASFCTILKVLPLYLRNRVETEPRQQLGPFITDVAAYQAEPETGLRVTWFGHSSSLLEIDGLRVLIDPVWEQRASPVQWFGPKRFFPPTLPLADLPAIDVVLISHDHYDHFGSQTVKRLASLNATTKAKWVTSLGVGKRLRQRGVDARHITELDWTQSVDVVGRELGEGLKVTACPARHFSGRGVTDRFKTLWSSFVLEGPRHRVYFGADSGWWGGFSEIAAQYDGFDLTMLEIGAYHPLWANIHLGPDAAVRAYETMGGAEKAGLFMPIHWGLFNLALHAWRQPIERVAELNGTDSLNLFCPRPGLPTEIHAKRPHVERWWANGCQ